MRVLITGGTSHASGRWVEPSACALALLALRLVLLRFNTDLSQAFSHDSAYIAIVARNLLSGKGWVNDASWLLFLHPAHLPMPYHNANPLYPLWTALAARAFDIQVVSAGLLVSALANVLLLPAAFYLVSYWAKNTWTALLISLAVTFFPPLWEDSLRMLPDALHLTLLIGGMALFVRAEKWMLCAAAGVFFGAAWLTRSTASLIAPALLLYACAVWGWRKAAMRLLLVAVTAALVAAPWWIHAARVWGSPFRSDASYYAFQDLYARSYGGSVDRYWHSPTPPPSPRELFRTDGLAVLSHTVLGIPKVLRAWLRAGWEDVYLPRIVFVILLVAMALISRRHLATAPLLASALYGALQIAAMAVRADSLEARYLAPFTALTVIWLGYGIATLLAKWRPPRFTGYALILGCVFFAVYVPVQDGRLARQLSAQDAAAAQRRRIRRSISATITHQDAVIVYDPYYYSYDTGAQALSIPESNDAYLMRYMDQYHCRWVILSDDELRFWKPDWPAQLPSWLRIRAVIGGNTLLERVPS
ncbi:MAG: hypothetical protein ABSH32_00315 [Bryobacteraceae bacterium]|jgi:4-amino-4-deoxy-L-arabinose transferase-like glycosyltransferase